MALSGCRKVENFRTVFEVDKQLSLAFAFGVKQNLTWKPKNNPLLAKGVISHKREHYYLS